MSVFTVKSLAMKNLAMLMHFSLWVVSEGFITILFSCCYKVKNGCKGYEERNKNSFL